jgi:putative endonuclease
MRFTVYVLYSTKASKHYTGYTSNLVQRLFSHNHLGKDWTSKNRPWILIYVANFEKKRDAILHEKWLKSGVGREFIKKLPFKF